MSYNNGVHYFNGHELIMRLTKPHERRHLRRVQELADHNRKVAIGRQDLAWLGPARKRK